MTIFQHDSQQRKAAFIGFITGLFFVSFLTTFAAGPDTRGKISPTIKLSYKIINGEKTIRAAVTTVEEGKSVPVKNLIVNLYLSTQKKYDPREGDGWVGNHVTDNNGHVDFFLPLKVSNLNSTSHQFFFIASIGSDPVFKDTRESIKLIDDSIELSFKKTVDETIVIAKLVEITEDSPLAIPQKEIKLFLKRGGEEIAFDDSHLITDANGMVSAILESDMIGDETESITIVARYFDQENNGLIEASQVLKLKTNEAENTSAQQGLQSRLKNSPMTIVVVVSLLLIMLIFFFRAKKKQ